jgi:hypothetical protein
MTKMSTQLSPSWDTNSCSGAQQIRRIVRTAKFITVFTRVCYWTLTWITLIDSTPYHLIRLRSILILYSNLPLGLITNYLHALLFFGAYYMSCAFHPTWFKYFGEMRWNIKQDRKYNSVRKDPENSVSGSDWGTPSSWDLLQNLMVGQLVKELPDLYKILKFSTVFISSWNWFTTRARWIPFTPSSFIPSDIPCYIIFPFYPRDFYALPYPYIFLPKCSTHTSSFPCVLDVFPIPSPSIWLS